MGRILFLVILILVIAYVVVGMIVGRRVAKRRAVRRRELAAIVARCEQQNTWFLVGDPRGVYGEDPMYHSLEARRARAQECERGKPPPPDRSWIEFQDWRGRTVPPPLSAARAARQAADQPWSDPFTYGPVNGHAPRKPKHTKRAKQVVKDAE